MVASQNGFCSDKLAIHKKTNIMQIMTKNITFFNNLIFKRREIVKLDHFMTLSLSYANTVMQWSHCKIHRFVAAPHFYSTFLAIFEIGQLKLKLMLLQFFSIFKNLFADFHDFLEKGGATLCVTL